MPRTRKQSSAPSISCDDIDSVLKSLHAEHAKPELPANAFTAKQYATANKLTWYKDTVKAHLMNLVRADVLGHDLRGGKHWFWPK